MSRVGSQPIELPSGVDVTVRGQDVTVKGPRGTLNQSFHDEMSIARSNGQVLVERPSDSAQHKALHGLTRSLLNNMVVGVSEGFERILDLVGVGYRVQQTGQAITLTVMLSHAVEVQPLPGITLEVEGNARIHVRGMDKQAVGQQAAEIRKVRPPNVYTGKGIRYANEIVHIKPGKSARRA
ncbi:MAG: 50S ribosomal protein L6 [SAR202 cluster bacterium]|jgi:large subunit ribosomal protein L6|nr:50S ribosomal protein L6 [Chloroflexota bacterium]MDP6420706.1 50S ribosomal protein L6 [SAR202 cluster bacterium]HAL48626.1 50S ribosomal protein L6 [Dehalococcoidia bacterium]MDP6663777.1 50S ribosomal protein L6 [SAR202 cluster bacterium]MDP6798588.1 50S ribosomal protein L6 [SAR202 cluster bacterium]|tara:strand:- start:2465 stop:3007 length:543 start_codon:yes stop_codon:yes gene_type:complete